MNVSTLISEVSRTRKLLQVAAYHSTALPSVQLSDERFKSAKPFLKQLFRAFGKQGFEILISTWGEIYAFSVVRELGIKSQVTEEALGEKLTMGNFNEGDLEYRIFNMNETTSPFVLRYTFTKSRSKWRSISFESENSAFVDKINQALTEIITLGRKFEGRTAATSELVTQQLTVDDLHAFALYAKRHVPSARAWRRIQRVCGQSYIESFNIFDEGINIETKLPSGRHTIHWQKAHVSFNQHFLTFFESKQLFLKV